MTALNRSLGGSTSTEQSRAAPIRGRAALRAKKKRRARHNHGDQTVKSADGSTSGTAATAPQTAKAAAGAGEASSAGVSLTVRKTIADYKAEKAAPLQFQFNLNSRLSDRPSTTALVDKALPLRALSPVERWCYCTCTALSICFLFIGLAELVLLAIEEDGLGRRWAPVRVQHEVAWIQLSLAQITALACPSPL